MNNKSESFAQSCNRHRRKTNSSEVGSRLHDAAKEMKTSSRRNKFEEASWE
jgi:hypothetical protein